MLISTANDLIMLFVSIELVSIPAYILAGFEKSNPKSSEASLKYFLLGVLASAVMVYGFSLVFGLTKEINLYAISRIFNQRYVFMRNPLLISGIAMSLVGFAFKIAAVPFHFWDPIHRRLAYDCAVIKNIDSKVADLRDYKGLLYVGFGIMLLRRDSACYSQSCRF